MANPRPKKENLKSVRDRTPDERKKLASKAGQASAEARRRKADIRNAMNELLKMPAKGRSKDILNEMGYGEEDQFNANAVAAKLYQMAMGGNSRAMEMLLDYFFKASEDDRKTKESEARVKALATQSGDLSVNSQDGDDGGVVIYLPEIEKEEDEQAE